MGHISHEPSMEEILSSIKRIIAEDGDGSPGARTRRAGERRAAPEPDNDAASDEIADEVVAADEVGEEPEILELTDELPAVADEIDEDAAPAEEAEALEAEEMIDEEIVSSSAAIASRDALASLSKMLVKPEAPAGDNTLEGLVREMLRPMLKQWLDANLPHLVEAMVAKEIARISGKGL